MASKTTLFLALIALTSVIVLASDPTQLQDFCVADLNSTVYVNGWACKNPNQATANDFYFTGLNLPTNTNNRLGWNATQVTVTEVAGLNTLGVAAARVDVAPRGLVPPHTHPRASELMVLLKGRLLVGFITSNPENKLFTKNLNEGDVFVYPQGLIHFQHNPDEQQAAVFFSSFGSQNPGQITVAQALLRSNPLLPEYILVKALNTDKETVEELIEGQKYR